jgi:tRNA-splicing ligase RtcB
MGFALDFAHASRKLMMERTRTVVLSMIKKYGGPDNAQILRDIDVHHNYAALENHYGSNVMVHRKGAIRLRVDKLGVIPGSMGTASYIVRGRHVADSFNSCSHGAGRQMGRKAAQKKFSVEHVVKTMKGLDIVLVTPNKQDIASECLEAYKSIEDDIKHEHDLIEIENKLRPVGVLKA